MIRTPKREAEMGRLVVTEFLTLDGVFTDPGGAEQTERGGWALAFERGEEGDRFKLEELQAADAQLLGRRTYEGFAAAWPAMEESTGEFGRKMNAMPKYVVSSTLEEPAWRNTTVLRGPLAEEVAALKERYAGDVLVAGSGQLVRGLLTEGLVDELRLMIFPVVLGAGERQFADGGPQHRFEVVETATHGQVVTVTLRSQRA
jgi:dihydrofolate reductase